MNQPLGHVAIICDLLLQLQHGWYVGVSVCWTHWWALQKLLNRSRCRLGCGLGGFKESLLDGGCGSPQWKGQFGGCSLVLPLLQQFVMPYCCIVHKCALCVYHPTRAIKCYKPSCCWGTARRANVDDLYLKSPETDEWPSSSFKVTDSFVLQFSYTNLICVIFPKKWVKKRQIASDLQGHSRSLALVPSDRPYMISYQSSIGSISLSCTIFEILTLICKIFKCHETLTTYTWGTVCHVMLSIEIC